MSISGLQPQILDVGFLEVREQGLIVAFLMHKKD